MYMETMPNQIKLIFDLLIDWRIIFRGNLLICQKSVSYSPISRLLLIIFRLIVALARLND